MKIRRGEETKCSSKSTSKIQGKRRIRGRNKSKLVRLAAYPMVTVVVVFLAAAAAAVGNRARNFEGLAALPYTDSTLYTPRNEHGT